MLDIPAQYRRAGWMGWRLFAFGQRTNRDVIRGPSPRHTMMGIPWDRRRHEYEFSRPLGGFHDSFGPRQQSLTSRRADRHSLLRALYAPCTARYMDHAGFQPCQYPEPASSQLVPRINASYYLTTTAIMSQCGLDHMIPAGGR